ncbi:MAG: GDP-mannose 4,6-dehydratase [Dehalococcoidia bacterium]|nr:GDP-mannose 4,6-dehydratase [Dehalococcoidia bacterium]
MRVPRVALITGITGQDGSYLAEQLLDLGHEVHGLIRRSSSFNTDRIEHLYVDPHVEGARLRLHYGDLLDSSSLRRLIEEVRPDEVYNLAAQSHVRVSFDMPEYTAATIVQGTTSLLEAIRQSDVRPRFYQAGSSEMFGAVLEPWQNESSPFRPQSPYAAAKVGAHAMVRVYREAYGLFAVNGILFNHESPRRSPTFVTRKITRGVARILAGVDAGLFLGNLEAHRDWGYAPEFMEAVRLMLQQDEPDDYVIATGETHSVREFLMETFRLAQLDPDRYVHFDPAYLRPAEVDSLRGDASKAAERLGWTPRTKFAEIVRIMLEADCREVGLDPANVLLPADEVV